MIKITDYKPDYQAGIDRMMLGIEKEFPVPITSPQSTRINEVYQRIDQKFWVALHENQVVGTIGLCLFTNGNAVVKRMMVAKDFRGAATNTATLLLDQAFAWAREKEIRHIYLGTMDQFHAAQKFYLKKGFTSIQKDALPADYETNPIDTLYYRLDLN